MEVLIFTAFGVALAFLVLGIAVNRELDRETEARRHQKADWSDAGRAGLGH